jgi:hypothetical protein
MDGILFYIKIIIIIIIIIIMKIISHRGNLKGPIPEKENRPSYIDCALKLGFEVEVDVSFNNDSFWLGHDTPDYKISNKWIEERKDKLWFHCKNIESAHQLKKLPFLTNYFCHSHDPYIITSTGHLWVHDLTIELNYNCIIPLLNKREIEKNTINHVYAICTDYVINN